MEAEKGQYSRRRLAQIEIEKEECLNLRKQPAQMEEEFSDQNRYTKAINDELLEQYPGNSKLQNILIEKEGKIQQKKILENRMLEECREEISLRMQELDKETDAIEEEVRRKGDEDEGNSNTGTHAEWTRNSVRRTMENCYSGDYISYSKE